jgi:hypothetical protein
MRYRLRTLVILMVATGIFFGGYRLGWQQGRKATFSEPISIIRPMPVPYPWGDAGPGSLKLPEESRATTSQPDDPFVSPQLPLAADATDPFAPPPP